MENNEELVTNVTENVEETTEQTQVVEEPTIEKVYTEDDFNNKLDEVLPKKIARKEAKIRKEYEKKYGKIENLLKAGLGVESLEEAESQLSDFYSQKGVQIPTETTYSRKDLEVLAKAEANEMIEAYDYSELEEEANRLANIGVANMSERERLVFEKIGDYLVNEKSKQELATIGVTEKDLNDKEYLEFKKNLNPNMSEKDKYEMYTKYRPKPEVEIIGSMKNNINKDTGVKDFYTRDEAMKFTKADFDKNPALFKAVENSMSKW
ncbi:MAG: hypothetical protein IJB83_02675 [Bacilli bacterium]|nr:hypothetical protein [Bacilli bacterium]